MDPAETDTSQEARASNSATPPSIVEAPGPEAIHTPPAETAAAPKTAPEEPVTAKEEPKVPSKTAPKQTSETAPEGSTETAPKESSEAPPESPTEAGTPPPPPVPGWMHQSARWSSFHIGASARRIWGRPGAPSVLFGAALILAGALLDGISAIRVPMIAVGVILFVLGILGPRLRMRFGLRLEEEGLDVSMQLGIAARPAYESDPKPPALPPPAEPHPVDRDDKAPVEGAPEVLESTAETIAFDAEPIRAAAIKAERNPRA